MANRVLDSGRALLDDMAEIIGNLFQRSAGLPCPMGEVMAWVVKGNVSNHIPFLLRCLLLERAEPLMNAKFGQVGATLGGEDIWAGFIAATVLEIEVEGWRTSFKRSIFWRFFPLWPTTSHSSFGPTLVLAKSKCET